MLVAKYVDPTVLQTEIKDGVARLILNRPEKRNALSWDLLRSLEESLHKVSSDRAVRAVVLAAEGPVFCSGHDLKEMVGGSTEEYRQLVILCTQVMQSSEEHTSQ